uniref:Putative methyltransferase n=1 Tax=viral metagenome TaxID=1070528 RepID=A0A6M3KQB7_9ZZZZ
MRCGPFFNYYGGKWRAAPRYPDPNHGTIVEPFAGAAGYSTRHAGHRIILCDANEVIAGIWSYLIRATPAEIRALPDVPRSGTVDDLRVPQEVRWLIGFWLNNGSASPARSPSSWARKYGEIKGERSQFWGPWVKSRLAKQVPLIRHWRVIHGSYADLDVPGDATWFIDPPYQVAGVHYPCGARGIDYGNLADWCRARRGQVVVCEQAGATWLPFQPHVDICNTHNKLSREVIWTSGDAMQSVLL